MANKHKRINYLKLAVEERIRRGLSNREFQIAYGKSCKYECRSMQDRINSIARNL